MTDNHPITPPTELVEKWVNMFEFHLDAVVLTEVAQWGADRELEACVEWFDNQSLVYHRDLEYALRAARRPKPPSLKEQALKMLRPLSNPVMPGTPEYRLYEPQVELIRKALEALDD